MASKIETKTNNNNNKENGIFFSQLGRVEGLIPKEELLSFLGGFYKLEQENILKRPFFLFRQLLYSHPNLNFPRWHPSLNFDHCAQQVEERRIASWT